jgi:HD-GYP domain-containing protein (c-di-GMP phosphodiesterase class II)
LSEKDSNLEYFSISFHSLPLGEPLAHDLFINSSGLEDREKFVRILRKGAKVSANDLTVFREKYRQLYVPESQRADYLRALETRSSEQVRKRASVLKEAAIGYLDQLFKKPEELTAETLSQTLDGFKDVALGMVDALHAQSLDSVRDLIGKLSFHDFYTYDHSINVAMYSILIYKAAKPDATREEAMAAGLGGLLHDIGKIKIPTHIINKPGKLTPTEFRKIQEHPDHGMALLDIPNLRIPEGVDLKLVRKVVHEHHENFDGTGYPRQVKGTDIALVARVTAVADFFDAITTKRAYAEPLPVEQALEVIRSTAGKKIDPEILRHLEQQLEKGTINASEKPAKRRELATDFDPCQPHDQIPIRTVQELLPQEKKKAFGKIRVIETAEQKGSGKKKP